MLCLAGMAEPVDSERNVEFFASLSRCLANDRFLTRFYESFLASSPEVTAKFRDTDFERQKRAMASSLYSIVMALEQAAAPMAYLESIAEQHSRRQLDIPSPMYDLWLECLIDSVREADPEFSPRLEANWRVAMRFAIERMRARY